MEEDRSRGEGSRSQQQQLRPVSTVSERPLRPPHPPPYNASHNQRAVELGIRSDDVASAGGSNSQLDQDEDQMIHSRPEAVTRALRVLQVRLFCIYLKNFFPYCNF